MPALTSLMLAILACAGFCAVLIGNPRIGLYAQNNPQTPQSILSRTWLSEYLGASRWQLQRAWTLAKGGRDWDILYHVGGNGPWIQKIDDVVQDGFDPPAGCHVEQVHMVGRTH